MNGNSSRTPDSGKAGVRLRIAIAGILGACLGFGGGTFLARDKTGAQKTHARPATTERQVGGTPAPPDAAIAPNHRMRQRHPAAADSPGPRLEIDPRILADLVRADQPSLEERVTLFSEGDPVAAALSISADEKAALEHEWAKVKDRVVHLQRQTLRHEQSEDELWVGAGPFDGGALETTFRETTLATLGPERGDAFLEMIRAKDAFGEWGRRTSAAYSIQYDRQSDGSLVYRITEKPSPEGPAGRSWISNRIPPHIREITDVLGIDPEAPHP